MSTDCISITYFRKKWFFQVHNWSILDGIFYLQIFLSNIQPILWRWLLLVRGKYSISNALSHSFVTFVRITLYLWSQAARWYSLEELKQQTLFSHLPCMSDRLHAHMYVQGIFHQIINYIDSSSSRQNWTNKGYICPRTKQI